jgi:ATP-binding cassette subfamily F protein uup
MFCIFLRYSVEALSEALSTWGEETGAIVVVSHDKEFCGKIQFSHVASVLDGVMVVEQRDARESDWIITDLSAEAVAEEEGEGINVVVEPPKKEMDPKQRKLAFNAPKRIEKLEEMVEEAEAKIAAIEEDMLFYGDDVEKLCDLIKKKEKLEREVSKYMKEWEELEDLLAQIA